MLEQETSFDTDNDHVTSHGDIKFSACYVLQRIITLVMVCLILLIMEEEEKLLENSLIVLKDWNLRLNLSRLCEKHNYLTIYEYLVYSSKLCLLNQLTILLVTSQLVTFACMLIIYFQAFGTSVSGLVLCHTTTDPPKIGPPGPFVFY